jgi:hypothetical protein
MFITPIQFASNIFQLNGIPLQMPKNSMKHLIPIYNKPSSAIVLKFGRQTHKSTILGFKTAIPAIKYPYYHVLYAAPTGKQISVFSTDKLDTALKDSPIIKNHYFDTKTKDQISYKELVNGSKIYLRSMFHTADSIRGISADVIEIDEVQDIISDQISVVEQSMSHSLAKWERMKDTIPNLPMHLFNCKLYAGTPKTVENTLERYCWANSTQNEWIIKCENTGCKKYNYINENNIGDTCLICNKCGKPIYYENGQWVSMGSGFIDGYRLPQIVLNWINNEKNPKVWQINVIQTKTQYSIEKYYNEVLALSYAAARHPITSADIKRCCENVDMIEEGIGNTDKRLKGKKTYAGIDWGKGDTASGTSYSILTIGMYDINKFIVIFKKKYTGKLSEATIQIKDMLKIIKKFDCSLTIADSGDGRTSNAIMVAALGPVKFAEIYEHGTLIKKIKWDHNKGHYIINRTRVMTDIIMEIKRTEVSFFRYEQFKEFEPDFTGIISEYSEQTRMTKYDHIVPDDAFHSFMFSNIACKVIRGEYAKYLIGGDGEESDSNTAITVQ